MSTPNLDLELINDICNECMDYLSSVGTTPPINRIISEEFQQIPTTTFLNKRKMEIKERKEEIKLNSQINNTKEKINGNYNNIQEDLKRNDERDVDIEKDKAIKDNMQSIGLQNENLKPVDSRIFCKFENELNRKGDNENGEKLQETKDSDELNDEIEGYYEDVGSERLRKLSQQLPKIIITNSDGSKFLDNKIDENMIDGRKSQKWIKVPHAKSGFRKPQLSTKRRITKEGNENVALISNIPFEKMRLLNDAFHTLINLRWRWIILGTVLVHFAIWLVFAVFWYIAALAHYDFDPNPPPRRCVTGGTDFLNIFLASVEAQTTIGFGDRTIDEECPESIFLFIMQLIMGTGLSGVLTCVVYAKLTRPENFSKEGVGFSKNAVVSLRDGQLCLIFRVWDLNYDHIIGSEVNVYFIRTSRTKEGEVLKHYAVSLSLLQRQLMLWPVTIVHVIDSSSPLYDMTPEDFLNLHYEITVSLKGASASMGTYTQSQTSYLPREVLWGYRFASVVKYSIHEQKYVVDYANLDSVQDVDTPLCSGRRLSGALSSRRSSVSCCPGTPTSFTEQVDSLHKERPSSFTRRNESSA